VGEQLAISNWHLAKCQVLNTDFWFSTVQPSILRGRIFRFGWVGRMPTRQPAGRRRYSIKAITIGT
jgi:hypothetical protein